MDGITNSSIYQYLQSARTKMEEEFKTAEDVQKWLAEDRNVPLPVATAVASTLFVGGYWYPSSLLNIQREDLSSLDISPPHRNTLFNKLQQHQQPQQLEGEIAAEMQAMRLEIHGVRETLPSVLVGHVITPSQASRIPQVVSSVFDSLGLSLSPRAIGEQYELPTSCGDEWKFAWNWKSGTNMDDRVLERTSYKPVEQFLRGVGLFCVDISEGQYCVEKLLYNADVYTKRNQNPLEVRGQQVFLRHRVQGRSDLAVLRADNEGGYILRHNVKFVVEIKTVTGYRQSQTGCMREAQLQLIGLNAFNTNNSPPVVLSNLARVHQVLYLDTDEDWNYSIRVRHCSSFAAAIHFANTRSERACISYHFSRPKSPDPEL